MGAYPGVGACPELYGIVILSLSYCILYSTYIRILLYACTYYVVCIVMFLALWCVWNCNKNRMRCLQP